MYQYSRSLSPTFPGRVQNVPNTNTNSQVSEGAKESIGFLPCLLIALMTWRWENTKLSVRYLKAWNGKDIVAANVQARQMLMASSDSKRDWDIMYRIPSPAALWRGPKEFYSPRTNGAGLELLEKYGQVKIGVRDYPIQKLTAMEEVTRHLRSYMDRID